MRPLPIEPLAGAPTVVKGLSLIRGSPLPVVALAVLLDGEDGHSTRFVTVRTGQFHVALAVDAVLCVHRIAASLQDLPPLLRNTGDSAVAAVGTADTELLLVLNAARLVPDSLWATLNGDGA